MGESIRRITKAVASGDPEAFSRFYEKYFDDLYRMARYATKRDEQFCLDVVQDAMMKVIKSIPILDSDPTLRAWLRRTVYSCAIDRLRIEARQGRAERRAAETARHPDDADLVTGTRERMHWLEKQLAELDGSSQTLLIMRHRFGWTLARIGRELGLSTGAVDGRLSRLIDRLRQKAKGAAHDK